jgi:hypothetical protein
VGFLEGIQQKTRQDTEKGEQDERISDNQWSVRTLHQPRAKERNLHLPEGVSQVGSAFPTDIRISAEILLIFSK